MTKPVCERITGYIATGKVDEYHIIDPYIMDDESEEYYYYMLIDLAYGA